MSGLVHTRSAFIEFLRDGDRRIGEFTRSSDDSARWNRLENYFQGYRLRLRAAVKENFPALHAVLGDSEFENLCEVYFRCQPPSTFTLRDAGDRLPVFLAQCDPYSSQLALSQLAQFEWALRYAFDAADVPHLKHAQLADIAAESWPSLVFELHPTIRRLKLDFNVVDIWREASQQNSSEFPAPLRGPAIEWVVWRREFKVLFRPVSSDEVMLLECIEAKVPFVALCEAMQARYKDANQSSQIVAQLVGVMINDGLYSGCRICSGTAD